MRYWTQPWGRTELAGREARLQILDPVSAFELEPRIVKAVSGALLVSISAPAKILEAEGQLSVRGLAVAAITGDVELDRSIAAMRQLAKVARELMAADLDGVFVAEMFSLMILDRVEIEGEGIPTWKRWSALRLPPLARWQALAAQLVQTFGPLWTRSPYPLTGRKVETYGVPSPDSPIAVQWAAELSSQGHASGVDEVLTRWTPERMIQSVEKAAQDAEIHRRASDAARARSS